MPVRRFVFSRSTYWRQNKSCFTHRPFKSQYWHFRTVVSLTWIHSERLLCAGDQAFVFPCLSSRANWGCHVNVSIPHVQKELEAVIWPSEMSRDFIPKGSEQPAVFELTVNHKQTGGRREGEQKAEKEKEWGKWMHPRKRQKDLHPLHSLKKIVRKVPLIRIFLASRTDWDKEKRP